MKEKTPIPVFIVTAFLVTYTLLISLNAPLKITGFLFFLSPFLLIWMVIPVLKFKNNNVKELAEGEEWGYADKEKEDLGIF